MVEGSDLQAAVQRTQAMARVQQLQSQQEEMNRKRFELEAAKELADKKKKVQDTEKARSKRVDGDWHDHGDQPRKQKREAPAKKPADPGDEGTTATGGIDVRV